MTGTASSPPPACPSQYTPQASPSYQGLKLSKYQNQYIQENFHNLSPYPFIDFAYIIRRLRGFCSYFCVVVNLLQVLLLVFMFLLLG